MWHLMPCCKIGEYSPLELVTSLKHQIISLAEGWGIGGGRCSLVESMVHVYEECCFAYAATDTESSLVTPYTFLNEKSTTHVISPN